MTSAPIAGYKASVFLTSTPSVTFTNTTMTDSGDHATFTTTTTSHRYWDKTATTTVQTSPDGTTWTTVTTGFSIQYVGGEVIFNPALSSGTQVRSSGKYFPFAFLGYASEYDITPTGDIYDITSFTNPSSIWKSVIPGLVGVDVKLNKFWLDATFMTYMSTPQLIVLILYPGQNANQRFEGYAYTKADQIKIPVNGVSTEPLDFTVDGQLYFIAS